MIDWYSWVMGFGAGIGCVIITLAWMVHCVLHGGDATPPYRVKRPEDERDGEEDGDDRQ